MNCHHHHAHLVGVDKQRDVFDDGQSGREGGHVQVGTVDHGLVAVPENSR